MKPTRLYERVAAQIAAKIAAGEFELGARLPSERELVQAFDVSRPTVREAIFALELDGMVEVRMGSGVYVAARSPRGGAAVRIDVGPFELLEARRAFEAEAAALAAQRIDESQISELEGLLQQINDRLAEGDIESSERADQAFHLKLAEATGNSAVFEVVSSLWDARDRSPQYRLLTHKAREAGVNPVTDEHADILAAVRSGDPEAARRAMRMHLNRVFESLLKATEVHELEQAQKRIHATRRKFLAH